MPQIEFGTPVVPKSCTSAALRSVVTASSLNPISRAASALSSAQRRLWPARFGDFRSMKSAATEGVVEVGAVKPTAWLRLEVEDRVPRIQLGELRYTRPTPCLKEAP